jgi:hypothetical protein
MFSNLSSWLSAGIEAVNENAKLEEGYDEEAKPSTAGEEVETLPVWEQPPAQLTAFRDEWRTLVLGMMQDENTFIITQERLKDYPGVWSKVLALVPMVDEGGATLPPGAIAPMSEASVLTMMAVVQERLVLKLPEVDQLRFRICPRYVSDSALWNNLQFRLAALHMCASIAAAMDLLTLLNTEPSAQNSEGGRKKNIGTWDNLSLLQQIRDAVTAKAVQSQWVEQKKKVALEYLESARNSCSMLLSLLTNGDRTESGELMESIAESCKYHKTKISGLIGEVCAPGASEKLQGSGLEEEGVLLEKLLELNEDLHQALERYTLRTPAASKGPPQGSGTNRSEARPQEGLSGSPDSDTAFNAQLPWDDDE